MPPAAGRRQALPGEREPERGPRLRRRLERDGAAVLLDDLTRQEQADPRPPGALRGEEAREDLLLDLVVHPAPGVGDFELEVITAIHGAKRDPGRGAAADETGVEGVGDEVLEAARARPCGRARRAARARRRRRRSRPRAALRCRDRARRPRRTRAAGSTISG